jgi:hypothetical protein
MQERRLQHPEEAEKFYPELAAQGMKACVGMEASGHARWFERLLAELQFELWIGDAAEIRTKRVRKQKTDRRDAQLILRLMLKDDFPQIWVPSWENRDLRQLLWRRHRMVQAGTGIMNQLQAVAARRGPALQEAIVAGSGTRATGGVPVSSLCEPAEARSTGVARPAESDDRGPDAWVYPPQIGDVPAKASPSPACPLPRKRLGTLLPAVARLGRRHTPRGEREQFVLLSFLQASRSLLS